MNFDEAEEIAVIDTLKSRWISSGPKCEELEELFAKMLSVQYALGLSSCTAALHLALLALGIKTGDEVIVPSLTFVATVNCVKYVGAKPVFCDVESLDDLTISPNHVRKLINRHTKAIIPMHYAGFPANMDKIMEIAKEYDLKVIEDACHGPLSEYHKEKVGTIGDVGCFSFFSNKNISTGEGGMLVTNDEEIYQRAKLLRSHGMTTMSYERAKGHSTNYDVIELGYNYRLDDIRASIGIAQLHKLYSDIQRRQIVRKQYLKQLENNKKIIIPFRERSELSSSYIFPIIMKDADAGKRDQFRQYLGSKGIQTSVHYPAAHRFSIYRNEYKHDLSNTDYVTDNEITLPMYGKLTEEEIRYICESINRYGI